MVLLLPNMAKGNGSIWNKVVNVSCAVQLNQMLSQDLLNVEEEAVE